MKIKTWRERCNDHPDHEGIVTHAMIQARMQEEIDELREALRSKREWVGLTDEEIEETCPYDVNRREMNFARDLDAKLQEKNT